LQLQKIIRRFRLPALFCALAVLLCELLSRPYVNMGIADDWSYIRTAQILAATGHIVYNGWATAMLGWQLYLAVAFIKLFGFSFTAVRMSTVLVAMALAFVLQRTLVRSNISERNATIGTLAFVLSPLYLVLSVTFMSDITGLFAIVVCLYGCIRALQSATDRAAIAWLCFAVATNALCGTSRQISWLGILVMVPSTLWLLRARRRVFIAGAAATLAGALFIVGCMHWFSLQPYSIPEHVLVSLISVPRLIRQTFDAALDLPFLLLPLMVLFLPDLRKIRPTILAILSAFLLGYLFLAVYPSHLRGSLSMVPGPGTVGEWVNTVATFAFPILKGSAPAFVPRGMQAFLTLLTVASLLGLLVSLSRSLRTLRANVPSPTLTPSLSWTQFGVLLTPFLVAYMLLLGPRAATLGLHDRYFLAPLLAALICLVRYTQESIQDSHKQSDLRPPLISLLLIAVMAIYSIAATHDMFSLYRARVALAAELNANHVPDTSVDNGWEYNFAVELQRAGFLNDPRIEVPAHAYAPRPPLSPATCRSTNLDYTPHIQPLYGASFTPNACYGLAPFAPVHYSRWPYSTPGTLYVVRYLPPSKPSR
jgi:hypothetical protein